MSAVRIRIEDFEDGVYPDVCASTGVFGETRLYERTVSTKAPGWLLLGLLAGPVGIVAALVLSGALRRSATGVVPYHPTAQHRIARRRELAARVALVGLAVDIGSLVLLSRTGGFDGIALVGLGLGIVAAVVGGFFWINVPGSVGGTLDSTSRWIELDSVHPRFAAAYEEQEARRRAARRTDSTAGPHVW